MSIQGAALDKTVAVIPAAGLGIRMGAARAKQFIELGGMPLLAWTLAPFERSGAVDAIIVVSPADEVEYCEREIVKRFGLKKVLKVVAGGPRRQDSVRQGILVTRGEYDLVLIHDGVRPMIDEILIDRMVSQARRWGPVVSGLPARETVKEVDEDRLVVKTYDRNQVWLIQTPQVFPYPVIWEAHERAFREGWEATDDGALVERMGVQVRVVEGSERNIKITTPNDLVLARLFLEERAETAGLCFIRPS
jgi:2-C-methyl-D-erythritol 4-phosphate cytidylyltransferase